MIGLYIAFILPVILRFRQGDNFEHGAWSLGKHYKWIDLVSIIWVAIISILFLGPVTPTGIPWKDGFNWDVANYAPLTVGGALLLFGGWWLISAKNWFKGPVRMGTEEELEQIEAQTGVGGFASPGRHAVRRPRRPTGAMRRSARGAAQAPLATGPTPSRRRRSGRSPGP